MKTLIVYDNQGRVLLQITGSYTVPGGGVPYLEVEIPEGKFVTNIDTTATPNVPVFGTTPPTIESRLASVESAIKSIMGV